MLAEVTKEVERMRRPSHIGWWAAITFSIASAIPAGVNRWTTTGTNTITVLVDPLGTVYAATRGAGIYKSGDHGQTWSPANQGIGIDCYYVFALAVDPQAPATLYAASQADARDTAPSCGVFKSTDSGATWRPINQGLSLPSKPQLRITVLAVDPAQPNKVYAGAGMDGLFQSADGGSSWSLRGTTGAVIRTIAVDPTAADTIWVGGYFGLVRDDGTTTRSISSEDVQQIIIDPLRPQTITALTSTGLLKSGDGGRTWKRLPVPCAWSLAIDPRDPNVLYVGAGGCSQLAGRIEAMSNTTSVTPVVYKSFDGGHHWVSLQNPDASIWWYGALMLAIDTTDAAHLYCATIYGLFVYEQVPVRGDANGDNRLAVDDVFYLINYLVANGSLPAPTADGNEDGVVNMADVFWLIQALFYT